MGLITRIFSHKFLTRFLSEFRSFKSNLFGLSPTSKFLTKLSLFKFSLFGSRTLLLFILSFILGFILGACSNDGLSAAKISNITISTPPKLILPIKGLTP